MTKELSLFDTLLSTNTNTTKSQGDSQPSKEGSSLFDDLLKSVKTQTSTSSTIQENISHKSGQTSSVLAEVSKIPTLTTDTTNINTINITKQSVPNPNTANNVVDTATNETGENKSTQTVNVSTSVPSNTSVSSDFKKIQVETPTQQSSMVVQTTNEAETSELKTSIDSEKNTKISPEKQSIDQEVTPKSKDEIKNESQPYRTTSILDNEQIKNQKPLSEIERILIDKGITIPFSKSQKLDTTTTDSLPVNKITVSLDKTIGSSDLVGAELNQKNQSVVENKTTPVNSSLSQVDVSQLPKSDTQVEIEVDVQSPSKLVENSVKTDSVKSSITQVENVIKETSTTNNKEINTSVNNDKTIVKNSDIQSIETKQSKSDIGVVSVPTSIDNQVEKIENVVQSVSDEGKNQPKPIDSGVVSTPSPTSTGGSLFDELTNIKPTSINIQPQTKNIDTTISTPISTPVTLAQGTMVVDNNADVQPTQVVQQKQTQEVQSKVEVPVDSKPSTTVLAIDSNLSSVVSSDKAKAEVTNKQLAGEKLVNLNSEDLGKKLDIKIEEPKVASQNQPTTKPQNSLLDKLIEDSLKISKDQTPVSNVEVKKSEILLDEVKIKDTEVKSSLMENMYKSSVSKNISIAAMHNVTMAKEIAKNATSVTEVQKSADMLGINLEGIQKVSDQAVSDATIENKKDTSSQVNRAFLEKNILKQDILVKNDVQILDDSKKVVSAQEVKTNTNNATQKIVEIVISDAEVLTIQNRIIGARQQLGSMMSSVAKAMYENYKPPHTAFKIFLNPANLGQIAIMIRSQRSDNSLSISMNMSNSATLESVVANQNELRNALSRTFDDKHTFELDFKLDSDSSNNGNNSGFENAQQEQQSQSNNNTTTFEDIPASQEQKNGTYF